VSHRRTDSAVAAVTLIIPVAVQRHQTHSEG
jgi:hypothetical protein